MAKLHDEVVVNHFVVSALAAALLALIVRAKVLVVTLLAFSRHVGIRMVTLPVLRFHVIILVVDLLGFSQHVGVLLKRL